MNKNKNNLDEGIDEDDEPNNEWKIEDGITPDMINEICQKLNISHYAFDITKKCFLKHASENRNYPALVYYAVNNHMYYISNNSVVLSMIRSSQSTATFIKSIVLDEEYETKNIYKDAKIHENIRVSELLNYNDCVIISVSYTHLTLPTKRIV